MSHGNRLRRHRVELGVTQAELALAAGVSRQLVAAVEAGVNAPAVDAGLRLARALGCTAEDLFGETVQERRGPRGDSPGLENTTGPLVVAGCDPALSVAEVMLSDAGPAGLLALDATSGTALRSLRDGGIHAAVVHGRASRLPRPPVDVIRMQLAHWQVGLGLAPGLSARSLTACLEQAVPIVQRQDSAASQQALLRAAASLGRDLTTGPVASSHVEAARAAARLGCAAITTEGAAVAGGLRFASLETHTVELWLGRRWETHAGFHTLGNLVTSSGFANRVSQLGGYDLSGCGTVLGDMPPV